MMNYKGIILFMLLVMFAQTTPAQSLDARLGLGSFSLNRDYGYERPAVGWYFSLGFTYDYTPEWNMGTVFNRSSNVYFRESVAETPIIIGDLPIRSEIISDHFSFILSRKFPLPLGLKGRIGLGIGLAVDENRFYQPILFDEERGAYRGFNLVEQYAVGLIFPGQISLHKSLGNRLRLGLQAGIMMDQQFRMRGSYWGPELGYRF